MAIIIGLQEKKEAVKKIEKLVDKVKQANNFLDNLSGMKDQFTISYSVDISVEDGKPSASRTFRFPLIVNDLDTVRRNVLYQRGMFIAQINKLCGEYNISLSETEGGILASYDTSDDFNGESI